MASVRFVLHHKHVDGRYSILLFYRCAVGPAYKKLIGESIHPRSWSKKTHRAIGSAPGSFELNRYLDEQEGRVKEAVRQIRMRSQSITAEGIKAELSGELLTFWDYVKQFEEHPPQEVGTKTLFIYKRMFSNLRLCCPGLQFADVSQNTVDTYIKYRRKQRMNDSTIRNELTKLRSLMNYALKARVIVAAPKLQINISGVETDEVYLTDAEIQRLYVLVRDGKLEKHKELYNYIRFFVLGTQIGVRVSDLDIKPEYVSEIVTKSKAKMKVIKLVMQKTEGQVIIPLTKLAEEILEYFNWRVPHFVDQVLNRNIKLACKIAKIKDTVVWREKIDGEIIETIYQKWQLVSSHTMRRSFATNLYKRGAPSLMIMKITGHKKESSFLRYIRVSKQEAAEELAQYL